jgi:hypothetical protein
LASPAVELDTVVGKATSKAGHMEYDGSDILNFRYELIIDCVAGAGSAYTVASPQVKSTTVHSAQKPGGRLTSRS